MEPNAAANAAYVLYMLGALALFALVHLVPAFDLRGVGRVRRRRPELVEDEAEFDDPGGPRTSQRPEAIMLIPRVDLAMLSTLLAAGGVALGFVGGFWGPIGLDLALALSPEPPVGWAATEPLARVAQLTGGLCGGLIALRALRLFMALAALVTIAVSAWVAANYVLGRPLLG